MKLKRVDIGYKFHRLTVIKRVKNPRDKWLCKCDCGKECVVFGSNLRSGQTGSCGCYGREVLKGRVGEKSPNWQGGRHYDENGYVRLTNVSYPGCEKRNRAYEHHVVMAHHLGRPLLKAETVHHKNGVRDDNRIENLELWTTSHPYGQRVVDKVEWAKQILLRYEPEALKLCQITKNELS